MPRRRARARLPAALLCAAALAACDNTDLSLATGAAVDAVRAVTLSDEDVLRLAAQAAREADRRHALAPAEGAHARRLRRLAGEKTREGSLEFDLRVYASPEVNAFAMADGTIRVHAGLMDLLDDGELLFVVGHEMGHVEKAHIRQQIRLAYAASAVRKGIASQGGAAGDVAGSLLGGLFEALVNAQFSQLEEKEADDAGLSYLGRKGGDPRDAVSALRKLAGLGRGHSFLSTHPDPDLRAERLQAQLDGRALPLEERRRDLVGRLVALGGAWRDAVASRLRSWLP